MSFAGPLLDRRTAVARLLRDRGDLLVVTGLGSPTYDVAAAGDHERNFYLWGAMGGASLVGLGLSLARPDTPVLVVTGDGEMLMGMGGLATIALQRPRNLTIAVLDNGLYGETGGQASHTAGGTDLVAVARGCGVANARTLTGMEEVEAAAGALRELGDGPTFLVLRVAVSDAPRVLPSRDGAMVAHRMRSALGVASL